MGKQPDGRTGDDTTATADRRFALLCNTHTAISLLWDYDDKALNGEALGLEMYFGESIGLFLRLTIINVEGGAVLGTVENGIDKHLQGVQGK
jgi:hypothetical protein